MHSNDFRPCILATFNNFFVVKSRIIGIERDLQLFRCFAGEASRADGAPVLPLARLVSCCAACAGLLDVLPRRSRRAGQGKGGRRCAGLIAPGRSCGSSRRAIDRGPGPERISRAADRGPCRLPALPRRAAGRAAGLIEAGQGIRAASSPASYYIIQLFRCQQLFRCFSYTGSNKTGLFRALVHSNDFRPCFLCTINNFFVVKCRIIRIVRHFTTLSLLAACYARLRGR